MPVMIRPTSVERIAFGAKEDWVSETAHRIVLLGGAYGTEDVFRLRGVDQPQYGVTLHHWILADELRPRPEPSNTFKNVVDIVVGALAGVMLGFCGRPPSVTATAFPATWACMLPFWSWRRQCPYSCSTRRWSWPTTASPSVPRPWSFRPCSMRSRPPKPVTTMPAPWVVHPASGGRPSRSEPCAAVGMAPGAAGRRPARVGCSDAGRVSRRSRGLPVDGPDPAPGGLFFCPDVAYVLSA